MNGGLGNVAAKICNGNTEDLHLGVCHYCPKRSEHSIINTGKEDLIIFTMVQEL